MTQSLPWAAELAFVSTCGQQCMFGGDCTHDSFECRCYAAPRAATQGLDELEFVRSACHAAQVGNLEKLGRILSSKPEAVSWDGGTGAGTALATG